MAGPLPILEGRRFGCTRCGNCCREPGYVFLSWRELEAAAAHLGMPVAEVREQFEVEWSPEWGCWLIDATDGSGCSLLDEAGACRVHPVKPAQCAAFPFWPELLDDAETWERSKRFCPGLDAESGRLYSREEILRIRERAAAAEPVDG